MKTIVTVPPYAPYLNKIAEHPMVEGFRLNTVMPVKEPLEVILSHLKKTAGDKSLWIDLKCRQLRVARGTYYNAPTNPIVLEVEGKKVILDPSNPKAYGELRAPPWSIIELDHEIELDTSKPVRCYFSDGAQSAYIIRADGNRLIMLDGPQRLVGGGESVNILHPSLKIKGYFTEQDKQYIEAAKKVGIHNYILSYVESREDITDLLKRDPDAKVIAKIESKSGLEFVQKDYATVKKNLGDRINLMAARGDLYVEVGKPHHILRATREIIEADNNSVAASRIFSSLKNSYTPNCADITDIGFLCEIGYERLMIGDDICFHEESLFSALNLLKAIDDDHLPKAKCPASSKI